VGLPEERSMLSMKNYVREALFTAALFGSVGAVAASTSENSRSMPPTQSPKVAGHSSADESAAKQTVALAVFTNGKRRALDVG
jgi:hypothetical protein